MEHDDYDVLCNGVVVAGSCRRPPRQLACRGCWSLAFGYHEDRTPTHGYAATREAAMAAFAKCWRRE
jgi:hypothetical protein